MYLIMAEILTLNCEGLMVKRNIRDVFKNFKAYYNLYASNSRGVAILFNNNCEIEIHIQYQDESGYFVILNVTTDSLQYLLI